MGLVTIAEGCGKVTEFETLSCAHCQAVVAILRGVGVRLYEHHRQCPRCKAPVCRACDERMAALGACPGPVAARVEHALRTGRWDESFVHDYRSRSPSASPSASPSPSLPPN